jgi:hypothetical protein
MKYLLATTLILILCLPASARDWRQEALADIRAAAKADAPNPADANGWTFDVIRMWYAHQRSTIIREPFGVFASKDECEKSRAKKIVLVDEGGYRHPTILPNAPVITTTVTVGATATTVQRPAGPTETINVLNCRGGTFTTEARTVAQQK